MTASCIHALLPRPREDTQRCAVNNGAAIIIDRIHQPIEVKPELADDTAGCCYQGDSNIRDDLGGSVEFTAAAGQGAQARQWIVCLVPTTGQMSAPVLSYMPAATRPRFPQ